MMTKTQINKLIKMMNDLDYPFEAPLKESFIESIIQIEFNSNSTNCLEKLCNEVSILFKNQPDYLTFLRAMDGFEVNGLRLFSLSIPEPSVKNLFAVNEFYRNNDDFINPDLQERLVIGDDSISIFTYDIKGVLPTSVVLWCWVLSGFCFYQLSLLLATDGVVRTAKARRTSALSLLSLP